MRNRILNSETIGTLNLKIVRLERYLNLLKEQQYLSQPYPDYQVRITLETQTVQSQLNQLKKQREQIAHVL